MGRFVILLTGRRKRIMVRVILWEPRSRGKRVLIVDDVVTAGTAKREAIGKVRDEGGIVAGIGMLF